jgi:hypothetical protein
VKARALEVEDWSLSVSNPFSTEEMSALIKRWIIWYNKEKLKGKI